ncbi:MAG: hypothetical protein ACHP8A_10795, partial [Terriglobales bacterium]
PDAYAKALDSILSDSSVARELTQRAVAWAEVNSYTAVVRTLLAIANQEAMIHCIEGVSCA